MRFNQDRHLEDRELLMHADGELGSGRAGQVRQHLAACWNCRARLQQLEATISDFVQAHRESLDAQLPSAEGPRTMIKAQLAAASENFAPTFKEKLAEFLTRGNRFAYSGIGFVLATAAVMAYGLYQDSVLLAQIEPNPSLTPGATRSISTAEVCGGQLENEVQVIPAAMGREVFARYGINNPAARRYELDFLIAPELGGAPAPENFWPQPYSAPGWNAHVKDALEDRLHQLVCEEKVSLADAQQEIASDWISAYKKYFETDRPIDSHGKFLKDQPWEP